ncbi:MAG: TonB family protein [Saprospiraceae bacterium]|nr:TonB family protein [Saprospiraceae bacterium]
MKKIIVILLLLPITIFSQNFKTKKVKVISDDKTIKEEYYIRKDEPNIKEGEYIQFINKVKTQVGNYSNNKKDGEWKYYHKSGELKSTGNYLDDIKVGEWKYYDYYGNLDYSGNYTNNNKNGKWEYRNNTGKLNFCGYYKENIKDGKWTYYNKNKISSELYYSQGLIDSVFGYSEDDQLVYELRYFNDKTGLCKSYYDNGKIKEIIELKNREMDGICKTYFDNGQLHRETLYSKSKKQTVVSVFDYFGNKLDGGNLKDGNGIYIIYHLYDKKDDTLKRKTVAEYKDGELNGTSKEYYRNGKLESKGKYENGKPKGTWVFYNEDGSMDRTFKYELDDEEKNETVERLVFNTDNYSDTNVVEPAFRGGDRTRIRFLQDYINYPEEAREKGISGTVFIQFTINCIGEIESIKILRGVSKSIDDEAIKVITLMPRWNPGLQYGIPVRVQFNMPIKFTLAD